MMKNRKLIILFSVIIISLLVFIPYVSATEDIPIISINGESNTQNSTNTEEPTNNEEPNIPNINTSAGTNTSSNNEDNIAGNNLPQTGVAEDTTLFVFIAVCVVSAIYAFIRIRKYKNL